MHLSLAFAVVLAFAGVLGEMSSAATSTPATAEELAVASEWPESGCALRRAVVPPRSPAKAAASARLLTVLVFIKNPFLLLGQAYACGVGNRAAKRPGRTRPSFGEERPYLPPV